MKTEQPYTVPSNTSVTLERREIAGAGRSALQERVLNQTTMPTTAYDRGKAVCPVDRRKLTLNSRSTGYTCGFCGAGYAAPQGVFTREMGAPRLEGF